MLRILVVTIALLVSGCAERGPVINRWHDGRVVDLKYITKTHSLGDNYTVVVSSSGESFPLYFRTHDIRIGEAIFVFEHKYDTYIGTVGVTKVGDGRLKTDHDLIDTYKVRRAWDGGRKTIHEGTR